MESTGISTPFADFTFEADDAYLARLAQEVYGVSSQVPKVRATLEARAKWFLVGGVVGLTTFLALIVLVSIDRLDMENFGLLACGVGAAGAGMIGGRQEARRGLKQLDEAERAGYARLVGVLKGRWRLAFSEDGVLSQGQRVESRWAWTGFYRVAAYPSLLAVLGHDGLIAVPRSCLANEDAFTSFKSKIEAVLEQHGCLERQRIAKFLATNECQCQKCGYQLKGGNGRSCPECGLKLSFENVPGAFAAPMPPATL